MRDYCSGVLTSAGDSLYIVGKLLGHAQASTTERYAHLADDPLWAAADRISNQVNEALQGETNS